MGTPTTTTAGKASSSWSPSSSVDSVDSMNNNNHLRNNHLQIPSQDSNTIQSSPTSNLKRLASNLEKSIDHSETLNQLNQILFNENRQQRQRPRGRRRRSQKDFNGNNENKYLPESRSFLTQLKGFLYRNFVLALQSKIRFFIAALIAPVILYAILGTAKTLFVPERNYGISDPLIEIPDLWASDALNQRLYWVDLASSLTDAYKIVNPDPTDKDEASEYFYRQFYLRQVRKSPKASNFIKLNTTNSTSPETMHMFYSTHCSVDFMGRSDCNAAIEIHKLDFENKKLNYTIRGPTSVTVVDTTNHKDGMEQILLPIQQAIDSLFVEACSNITAAKDANAPAQQRLKRIKQFSFTARTPKEHDYDIRMEFLKAVPQILAIAFLIGHLTILYPLVSRIARDRESRLTMLLHSFGCNSVARILAYHLFYDITYLLGWIMMGVISAVCLFSELKGPVILYHIVFGLSLVSWGILASVFFPKSMLSGTLCLIVSIFVSALICLGTVKSAAGAAILSIIFPSANFVFAYSLFSDAILMDVGLNWKISSKDSPISFMAIFWITIGQIFIMPVAALFLERKIYNFRYPTSEISQEKVEESLKLEKLRASPERLDELTKIEHRRHDQEDCVNKKSISISNLVKVYKTGILRRNCVKALDNLSLEIPFNEVTCLLGQNGSGKSTTIEILAKTGTLPSSGSVHVNGIPLESVPLGYISICPQQDILWPELTVYQTLKFLNMVKPVFDSNFNDVDFLIEQCDLSEKRDTKASKLSGGQKRKLQLAISFIGGPPVCLMDEVTSALDPVSRRKIWDIVLGYKAQNKTIVFSTHYLDEAEILGNYIAIVKDGKDRLSGDLMELKESAPYTIELHSSSSTVPTASTDLDFESSIEKLCDKLKKEFPTLQVIAVLPTEYEVQLNSDRTIMVKVLKYIESLKAACPELYGGIELDIRGPSLDEVFLQLVKDDSLGNLEGIPRLTTDLKDDFNIDISPHRRDVTKRRSTHYNQFAILLSRRLRLIKGRILALTAVLFTTLFFSGLGASFVKDYQNKCAILPITPLRIDFEIPMAQRVVPKKGLVYTDSSVALKSNTPQPGFLSPGPTTQGEIANELGPNENLEPEYHSLVFGPSSELDRLQYYPFIYTIVDEEAVKSGDFMRYINPDRNATFMAIVNTTSNFKRLSISARKTLNPGGLFLDPDQPIMSWMAKPYYLTANGIYNLYSNLETQRLFNINTVAINAAYQPFMYAGFSQFGPALKFVAFAMISMIIFPAFSVLTPAREVQDNVRKMLQANGVKESVIFASHIVFEIPFAFLVAVLTFAIIASQASTALKDPEYILIVVFLYGIASILLAMIITKRMKSVLMAFGTVAVFNMIMFVISFVCMLDILTLVSPPNYASKVVRIVHYVFAAINPICTLFWFFSMQVNLFSQACRNSTDPSNWMSLSLFGQAFLYLCIQIVVYSIVLYYLTRDKGRSLKNKVLKAMHPDSEKEFGLYALEARNINKSFKKKAKLLKRRKNPETTTKVIEDVSLSLAKGQCFALLGPNGAGKTTLFSILEGSLRPDTGSVHINGINALTFRDKTRQYVGLCPQYNAFESMSVYDHCVFYAKIKGVIKDHVKLEADHVLRQVGLWNYKDKLARTLSGGNKRKLALAIALIGNPDIVLVDEASTGVDIAAKRHIWKTLQEVARTSLVVLTTHSMEEADALADNIAILNRKILAQGSISELRRKYCTDYLLQVSFVKGESEVDADYESQSQSQSDIKSTSTQMPNRNFNRMSLAAISKDQMLQATLQEHFPGVEKITRHSSVFSVKYRLPINGNESLLSRIFEVMEDCAQIVGIARYSVSQATLEDLFIAIV